MQKKKVKLSDGRTLILNVSDDATNEDIENKVKEFLATGQKGGTPISKEAPQEGPGIGSIAGGMATEIGLGATGKYGGAAIGTAIAPGIGTAVGYGIGAISSGIAGSVAAQKIEGRETISWGRAIAAGLINLIPTSEVSKAAIKSGKVLKEAAKIGAKEGAITGAAEAQITSLIDTGKFASAGETAAYAGMGGVLGGGLGAGLQSIVKKAKGKTPDQIDESVAHNNITKEEVADASTGGLGGDKGPAEKEVKRQVERSRNNFITGNSSAVIQENSNPSTGWMSKIYNSFNAEAKRWVAGAIPSLATGRRIADAGNAFDLAVKEA